MAQIVVDGKTYEVEAGQNLLEAVLSHHLDLPYFCWHPAMGSVGACRQCAVVEYANEDDTRGRLAMACITSVRDGMRFSIEAPHAEDFRKSVIEWLMENHPHDCPVCEEGGECHLQDMTVMTGHASRRYRGTKRTWENQYLGPFVGHEMNRCITCYRCVRFYRDYAGGTDLEAFGSRGRMYFGRAEDGVLESEFAGNLVEVCPTGVFTDRPFSKQYTRKWDLQSAPSVCPGCSVGCNIFPSERYGDLKRIHNRYHAEVNGYFLCDRGRFGSHFVNADARLRHAGVRDAEGVFEAGGVAPALDAARAALGAGRVVGIGSPRASVEANFALRTLVGEDNFCNGLSARDAELAALTLDIHAAAGARVPTISEVETADAVLVLGEDISNTAARVALALRQTARGATFDMATSANIPAWQDAGIRGHGQHHRSPVFIASVLPTRIDDIAQDTLRATPADIARAGFAVAHVIDPDFADAATDRAAFVEQAAAALAKAERPLIVTGAGCADAGVLQAAANIAWALKARGGDPALLVASGEANTMGVAAIPAGLSMEAALEAASAGAADTLVILENDLFRRADTERVTAALEAAGQVIVLDALETPTAEAATVALPAATYAESTGTFVNYEGRAQRFYRVFEPADEIAPSWEWIARMADAAGRNDCTWAGIDAVLQACARGVPTLSGIAAVAPAADYRVEAEKKIPRQPHRYSGRTAMRADVNIHEPKTTIDTETPLSYSMEGENTGGQSGAVVPYVWTPGWNSNQSVFKFQQEVGGPLRGGDPGVRLFDGGEGGDGGGDLAARFREAPEAFSVNGGYRLVPTQALFGSEELSARSWPILERRPAPCLVLHPEDAAAVGVEVGSGITSPRLASSFAVRTDESMTRGSAAVVVGYAEAPGPLPADPVSLIPDPGFVEIAGDPNVIARG